MLIINSLTSECHSAIPAWFHDLFCISEVWNLTLKEEQLQTTAMSCFPVFWRRKNSRNQIVQYDHGKLWPSCFVPTSVSYCISYLNFILVYSVLFADVRIAIAMLKTYPSLLLSPLFTAKNGRVSLTVCSSCFTKTPSIFFWIATQCSTYKINRNHVVISFT